MMNSGPLVVAPGLRPAIGAVDPYAGWTFWDHLANATTPEKQQRLAGELVKHLKSPGRERVLAVSNLIKACPPAVVPKALQVLRLCQPGHAAWQTAILLSWVGGSHVVVEAAENRETLREWLNQADLLNPAPFLHPFCLAAEELPEFVTIYRGGCHELDFLQAGFSWSPYRATAGWYALKRQAEHGGTAMVMSMTMPGDRVSLWTKTREAEVVVVSAEGAEVDTACPEAIQALADTYRPIYDNPLDSEMLRIGLR